MVRLATRLSGGGGAEFTPLDLLTDVRIWLRPDPEVLTLNGGDISGWLNRGSLANISESTESRQATLVSADSNFNGKPTASFDGVGNYYDLPDISSITTAFEMFVVLKKFEDPPVVGSVGGTWRIGVSNQSHWLTHTAGLAFIDDGSSTRRSSIVVPETDVPFFYHVISTGSEYTVNFDGDEVFTSGTNTVSCNPSPWLGRSHGDNNLKGEIADFIICGAEQTPAARAGMAAYVGRYGL